LVEGTRLCIVAVFKLLLGATTVPLFKGIDTFGCQIYHQVMIYFIDFYSAVTVAAAIPAVFSSEKNMLCALFFITLNSVLVSHSEIHITQPP